MGLLKNAWHNDTDLIFHTLEYKPFTSLSLSHVHTPPPLPMIQLPTYTKEIIQDTEVEQQSLSLNRN